MPGCGAMARDQQAVAANGYEATEAEVNAVRTGSQMFQTVLTDVERISGTVREPRHNFVARPRGAKSASPLHNDAQVCWNTRNLDIAVLRRWFIRRVAQEALKELQREEQHE